MIDVLRFCCRLNGISQRILAINFTGLLLPHQSNFQDVAFSFSVRGLWRRYARQLISPLFAYRSDSVHFTAFNGRILLVSRGYGIPGYKLEI